MCFGFVAHVTEAAEVCFGALPLPGQTIVLCISELYSDASNTYKAKK